MKKLYKQCVLSNDDCVEESQVTVWTRLLSITLILKMQPHTYTSRTTHRVELEPTPLTHHGAV